MGRSVQRSKGLGSLVQVWCIMRSRSPSDLSRRLLKCLFSDESECDGDGASVLESHRVTSAQVARRGIVVSEVAAPTSARGPESGVRGSSFRQVVSDLININMDISQVAGRTSAQAGKADLQSMSAEAAQPDCNVCVARNGSVCADVRPGSAPAGSTNDSLGSRPQVFRPSELWEFGGCMSAQAAPSDSVVSEIPAPSASSNDDDSLLNMWHDWDSQDTQRERDLASLEAAIIEPVHHFEPAPLLAPPAPKSCADVLFELYPRVAEQGLPIDLSEANDDGDDDAAEAYMFRVASDMDVHSFYIGATSDVMWRWFGGASDRGVMPGHRECYDHMTILACRLPGSGAQLETRLITSARVAFGMRCKNKAMDSRGCVDSLVNFIYLVHS